MSLYYFLQENRDNFPFENLIEPLSFVSRAKSCKYMNSAKRPLWLVFENDDELGNDVLIIFKNGDGKLSISV